MIYTMEEAMKSHANIKVFGVGGGGCNAVDRMVEMNLAGIDFIAANTDMQSLSKYDASTLVQLGTTLTRGLGAGGNPKVGREAALEDEDRIRSFLEGSDMVFITAGMGGGTGTGGAPVIAQIARELGALTIAVVTKPFRFEGKRRWEIAEAGIRDLEEFVDTLIVIPNQKLLSTVEHNTTLQDAFKVADEVLSNAVQGISDLITVPGLINLDFADVKTIMSGMGKALMGTGFGSGPNKALDAVQRAISSPLLDEMSVGGARGILINITGGRDLTLVETDSALAAIYEEADKSANIIFGTVVDETFDDCVKATVIATGFEGATIRENPVPISLDEYRNGKSQNRINTNTTPAAHSNPVMSSQSMPEEEPIPQSVPEIQSEPDIVPDLIPMREEADDPMEDIHTNDDAADEETNPEVDEYNDEEAGVQHLELEKTSPGIEIPDILSEEEFQPEEREEEPDDAGGKNQGALPFDHQTNKELSLSKPLKIVQSHNRPELDLNPPSNTTVQFAEKLPEYQRRDMSTIPFNPKKKEDEHSIAVDTANYMIPAFLRRKAD